ncbi:MAG: alanine--tRNA ligase [Bdellovibrionaceae bacterium]|nr:alanine--tRNA ligase [Pseudobdellovibrionaceae bacterium]
MKLNNLRNKFIQYFADHSHAIVPSSSLIPENDPTLLFTNAGMNQFKNVFLGLENREYNRAVTSQKCVRAGGKHNDLENVGFTARHHTFFEMLGNFSFGDYFKKEAIHLAWEFLTKELALPKDRLYVTVFENDDEAAEIWHKQEGVPKDRIYRFGEKDNFWRMGASGPCGPCSEIFYDLGPDVGGDPKQNVMGGEGDRFIEIWNLVFMQFNERETGQKALLPNPSIDTGMGLERLAAVMQGELSNYHTDAFRQILDKLGRSCRGQYIYDTRKLSPSELKKIEMDNIAYRVLADHARATAFLIGDGVLPSNEGRGYVLRRIMRRAIRYGRNLSEEASLLPTAVSEVIALMGDHYTELKQQKSLIEQTSFDEEKRFLKTLDQGTEILQVEISKLQKKQQKIISGDFAFKLYDTFGFPLDLTHLIARENGLQVNEGDFEKHMQRAKEIAKASWKGKALSSDAAFLIKESHKLFNEKGATAFSGFDRLHEQGKVLWLAKDNHVVNTLKEGDLGVLVCDPTCFYAESGGQVGDTGNLETASGYAEVLDCTKNHDVFLHHIKVTSGEIKLNESVALRVDKKSRQDSANNHSATHLLHAALKKVLGDHVNQAGSLVEPERLRFDFTHNQPLSVEQIFEIESLVNSEIEESEDVQSTVMTHKQALEEGAMALFGEKYADEVRVISMGDFSKELCGGTHVKNTSYIRTLKIVSEAGVSAGVRRIEAITGQRAIQFLLKNTRENQVAREKVGFKGNWENYLFEEQKTISDFIDNQREDIKNLTKELQETKGRQINIDLLIANAKDFVHQGFKAKLVTADIPVDDPKVLSELTDKIRDKIQSGVVIVVGEGESSHPIVVSVSKNLVGPYKAGEILKQVAKDLGGKGGGRPDFAQGAANNRSNLKQAFSNIRSHF